MRWGLKWFVAVLTAVWSLTRMHQAVASSGRRGSEGLATGVAQVGFLTTVNPVVYVETAGGGERPAAVRAGELTSTS